MGSLASDVVVVTDLWPLRDSSRVKVAWVAIGEPRGRCHHSQIVPIVNEQQLVTLFEMITNGDPVPFTVFDRAMSGLEAR